MWPAMTAGDGLPGGVPQHSASRLDASRLARRHLTRTKRRAQSREASAILTTVGGMFNTLFVELAAVMLTAGAIALVAYKLRQPLIIAYIITGIIVGPGLLGWAQSQEVFDVMSSIGIAFLLFIVGLNLNWRSVKDVGRVAIVAGFAQVIVTSTIGTSIALLLGLPLVTAIFLGLAFSFSSTIIIVKLLSDKDDLDRLYGRIAVGMLIVQDLVAMMILLVLAALREDGDIGTVLGFSLVKGIGVVVMLWYLSKYFIPRLFSYAAKNQELLFLIALAWCFAIASSLHLLGFGIEIGALLAGVSLAGTGFQHEIEAKIRSLRDFFLIIFFIVLGTHLTVESLRDVVWPALAMSAYVLIGNPIIAQVIMRFMGYHSRTAFLTGTTVAQISEFSFIMLAAGIAAGLVAPSAIPLATVVGLITIAGSSYLIAYNERIYEAFARAFPRGTSKERESVHNHHHEVLLFGYDRMGETILPRVKALTDRYLVVDFNPTVVEHLLYEGHQALYGDVGSEEVLSMIRADRVKMIISTIPDMSVNADILDFLKQHHSTATTIVTVKSSNDAARCYELGATFVIVPSVLSGQRFADFLKTRKIAKGSWKALGKQQAKFEAT